ncbi:hypothetical protein MAC_05679 [Metarhizium acridum CQMa 102]|uniref:HNH nuclease domain-containing protein n=1 Tax=Metarhizium acridum (strain CQMa 102) TaxID=655827 RepID=E9E731_METAQ|nr:uncharacterized protein MAC_05679 [Metarhizium acridum CQMa 102]EFY88206.1 hypothetical protein MAC_05679 [Metarhizium acridum CQMa 102]
MSDATVTPQARAHGWNIHFLAGIDHFAGLFHPPGSGTLRYRHIIDKLRLCFELPHSSSAPEPSDPWKGIAFGHVGFVNAGPGCATHIPYPSLRQDSRYLPPNKGSKDPNFTQLPYRKTIRPRGSPSPSKRSASGSVSPTKDNCGGSQAVTGDDDVTSLITPPMMMDMSVEDARQTMATFRTSCLVESNRCAVSGKGRGWCASPAVGPGVQACHIVPQQHYHVYPLPEAFSSEQRYSHRRLREAWRRTWQAKNGILLSKTLHELFDLRLFSIHPDTLRVRIFVPFDFLEEYHDRTAQLPPNVDRRALRHHYEMCCIEKMAAEMPLREQIIQSYAGARSIAASTLESDSHITSMSPESTRGLNDEQTSAQTGDPSKRRVRQAQDNANTPDLASHKSASFSANEISAVTPDFDKYGPDNQVMLERCKRCTVAGPSTYPRKRQRILKRENSTWTGVADNKALNDALDLHVFASMPLSIERFLAERSNLTDDEDTHD